MTVLTRPMFKPQIVRRQTGTPITGEMKNVLRDEFQASENNIKNLSSLTPDARDVLMEALSMRNIGVFKEKPELDDYGKTVIDPEFQNFLLSTYGERGQSILDTLLQGNNSENFSMLTGLMNEFTNFKISNEMKEKETVPSRSDGLSEAEKNFLNRLKNRAEGSPMEGERSDAVGIADGLDQETMQADPNTEGVAKVSPEQYVELMNQVRGDEVPMEGRVQELAMTVGEKDAQDTPLSVLALVQPVFELQEQQGGLAAAPGAQQMMQQQAPMMMKEGGIVYRENGSDSKGENAFSTLAAAGFDQNMLDAVQSLGKEYFGVGSEFDTQAARQQYEQMLINKSQMRDQAYLDAAPLLLQLGATALNPEASISDVFTVGASNLAKFGTNVGAKTKALQDQALKLALADKQKEENKESAYMSAIAPKLLETAFKDPQQVALTALDITSKTLDNLEKETKLGVLDETLQTELATSIASLEKMKTENKYLGTTLQLDIETKLEQLYGIQYDNNKKQLDNEYQTIMNNFAEDKESAALQGQLLNNINTRLNNAKLGIENEYIKTEKDLGLEKLNADINSVLGQNIGQVFENEMKQIELQNFDAMQTLELIEKQETINKLMAEAKEMDFEKINAESSFRKEFVALKVYKNTDQRYTSLTNLIAAAEEDSAAGDVAFIFDFMRMVDPNSVVKEGEFQLAEDASPLMKGLEKLLNKAKTGERLLPEQRDEFLSTARSIFGKSLETYRDTESEYKKIAGNIFGVDNVPNIIPGIQFDQKLLTSIDNKDSFDIYLKSIGIDG